MNVREAAKLLGVSVGTVYSLAAPRGPIQCFRPVAGRIVFDEAADRIDALERENAALRFQLLAASNYIDALGGVSNSYRAAIDAAMEQR